MSGFIRIKLNGENTGKFINECRNKGYVLYNIKKNDGLYSVDIKSKNYEHVISIAENYAVETEINGKFGLLMKLILYKGRKVFISLLLILALYYAANSCFISEISINGNNIFTDEQILHCLNLNDMYVGRLKFGIDPEIFQNEFIKDFPGISWIWVKIDGTKAIIDVRERITKPEFFDYSYLCNVVASKDGVITSAVSSSGTLLVKEGMFVKKGDILINGVYDSNDFAPVRFVNAGGKVYARTTYSIEDNFGYNYIRYTPKTKLKSFYVPKICDLKILDDTPNKNSDIVLKENDIKFKIFGKNYLPLAFTNTKYCEIIKEEYVLSKEEAEKYAISELSQRLKLTLNDDALVVNTQKSITPNSDGTFKASVLFECIEDIAVKNPIEVEMG